MIDHLKLHFISPSLTSSQTIPAQYDSLLVCLSVLTAVFASYISFLLSAIAASSASFDTLDIIQSAVFSLEPFLVKPRSR